MTDAPRSAVVQTLLDRHGTSFSQDLGIPLGQNTPAPLFQWLCAALLMSARISTDLATAAAAALAEEGWTTPGKMAESRWKDRVRVLNGAGYARYDESTATMLGEAAELLLSEYDGDLRRLREAAERDVPAERRLLKQVKGIGDVGADIFFREVQIAWDELFPFADDKALSAAAKLGLPDSAEELADLVDREAFPRLLAALIRADLAGELDSIATAAKDR